MIEITLKINYPLRREILLTMVVLALLIAGSIGLSLYQPVASASSAASTAGTGRHFILSNVSADGDSVLAYCPSGYHTASFWEIATVSNLLYDYDHPNAATFDDSGQGPPAGFQGWVRTGYGSGVNAMPGAANCINWTSTNASFYGTVVWLRTDWSAVTNLNDMWSPGSSTCNESYYVWCVRDQATTYLPVIQR